MNYEIHIQDVEQLEDPLILHYASRESVRVNHLGGDDKTKPIIGSELNFAIEAFGGQDAMYDQYFTSDEQKWLVTKRISETQEVVWKGFLLPESYTEPWKQQLFYVELSAVDGLGLLKGKELPDEFYSQEKDVISIISEILKLTGLGFELHFSPAIENYLIKEWHKIITDSAKFFDRGSKQDAHTLLENLVFSMRCQLFQANGRWYIEGINKRHLPTVRFHKYSPDGVYLGTVDETKNIKKVHWLASPDIAMEPAKKKVIVTHPAAKLEIKEKVFHETDIDWVKATGVVGYFKPKYWDFTEDYSGGMYYPDYYLELPISQTTELNPERKISLKEKIYVLTGTKIRLQFTFKLIQDERSQLFYEDINAHLIAGTWIDMIQYRVNLNDSVIIENEDTEPEDPARVVFDSSLVAKVDLEFIAKENGYLDIELFEPIGEINTVRVPRVQVQNITIEDKEQEEDFIYEEIIDEKSSQVEEIELAFSDDISGNSKSFYLEKVREPDLTKKLILRTPIRYGKQFNGKNYSIVDLAGAVLVDQYPEHIQRYELYLVIPDTKVVYNLNGGEEMAVETIVFYEDGYFYITLAPYKVPVVPRTEWLKWTDAIYGVEQKPYAQVVAEIESRLFSNPHLVIEGTADAPVKFNDLISFHYKGEDKYFVVTNCEWSPDNNSTQLTLVEGVYGGEGLGNIAPYVYAGPDIYISEAQTEVSITDAVATDPNGFIALLNWKKLSGDVGEINTADIINPVISGLIGNEYEFELTATDNVGSVATDTMKIFRVTDHQITFQEIDIVSAGDPTSDREEKTYKMIVTPEIREGETLLLNYNAFFQMDVSDVQDSALGVVHISKRGVELESYSFDDISSQSNFLEKTYTNLISYNQGDEIIIKLIAEVEINDPQLGTGKMLTRFKFHTAEFKNKTGKLTNLPASTEIMAQI